MLRRQPSSTRPDTLFPYPTLFRAVVLLDPALLPPDIGWRVCFGIGALLGFGILLLRRFVPESPRWLMIRGRDHEADVIVRDIERIAGGRHTSAPIIALPLQRRERDFGFIDLARGLFRLYPRRSVVGLVLMSAQAFFYNAIFFTYALRSEEHTSELQS